ncbi:MBL fold metallo-hydrolase [Capilliphycus salinus ALCB114379]|uniref:MBL fold metallo-hydrolase n=1 Tax=Capilliphycus salinus TaxID=2768948 RepID=UPI0039A76A1B
MLRMGPHRILLDCGIQDISPLLASTEGSQPADFVFCTHAHADHAVGLLALHQAFPQLPIYGSEVTAQLLPLNWPEFSRQEVPQFCQPLPWKSEIQLRKGLSATLFPAGHLPGAAAILLKYESPQRTYKLLYTGDFFLSNSRLVEGLPLGDLRGIKPDVLILEGSYGTARHPHRRQLENQLAERISQTLSAGYSVLFPTPALGLGQELLMLLRSHHYFTGRDIEIWVDSQVAQGCDIYLELLPYFPTSVQNFAQHQPLFWDERIRPRVRRLSPQQRPPLSESPCVVIAERQTCWQQYADDPNKPWVLFLPERPGIGVKMPEIQSPFERVETYFLSEHSDGVGMTQLIHNVRPQHIIFVHGSPLYLADLTNLDELRNRYQLHYPSAGMLVELPIGETFIQPALPENHYEAEVSELATEVNIAISQSITADPRWPSFADTGLVEVRWQGEELVLRGISQRELLNQPSDQGLPSQLECCGNCLYYRGQRCSNPSSAFYNFKVTPDGCCPVFEASQELEDLD